MSVRVRFAPSPTGFLHVGGARTAVFNWLFARRASGVFVLRIEDTDRQRSSEDHTRAILDGLSWLGLDWDEGPLFQSDGVDRHVRAAMRLLEEGKAYRDFSDPADVRAEAERRGMHPSHVARERADAMGPDESQGRAARGEPFALRFRVPEGETRFEDLVHGSMTFGNRDVDDLVILRSDGTPVYNLAVVSDDAEMEITHVIRGDDHLSNTPKQVLLYRALGLPEPVFAHVPMILGTDGKRLSKRHGATAVGEYEAQGILPEAMVNFLALLGWSPGDDREVMTVTELVERFDPLRILKKSAVFDLEKLAWLNGRHLAAIPTAELAATVAGRLDGRPGLRTADLRSEGWMAELMQLLKPRARTVEDLVEQSIPLLSTGPDYEEAAVRKHWSRSPTETADRMEELLGALEGVEWSVEALEATLRALAERLEVGAGKLIHPLRVALTGRASSPGIFEVLVLLGRDRSEARIRAGVERMRALEKNLS